jgi:CHASE1-domain containing sensor protein
MIMDGGVDQAPAVRRGRLRRMAGIVLPAAVPALIAGLCLLDSTRESRRLVAVHRLAAVTKALRQQAADRGEDLRSLELLLRPRGELDWQMFDGLARFGLLDRDDVGACAWAPRVAGRNRAEYESFVEVSAFRSFRISERDGNGRLHDAGAREEHFPLHFVAPTEANALPLGLDLASDPAVEAAMDRARDENRLGALLTSNWGRDPGESAVLVLMPVYRPRAKLDSVAARRLALEGFLVASVILSPEVAAAVADSDLGELQASLIDPSRPAHPFSPLDTSGQWLTSASGDRVARADQSAITK